MTGMGHQLTLVAKQREQSSLLIGVQIRGWLNGLTLRLPLDGITTHFLPGSLFHSPALEIPRLSGVL